MASGVHVCLGSRLLAFLLAGILSVDALAGEPASAQGRLYDIGASKLYAVIEGHGPPLLLLHGGLSRFETTFSRQVPYFSAFRAVVGVDQRGHGHSPDTDAPFSYRQMAEDTAGLLQKLGLSQVDVVGHSDGGNVGLLLARYHPELVRRLVVSGANIRGDFNGTLSYLRFLLSSDERFIAGISPAERDDYSSVSPDGPAHWPVMAAKTKSLWATRVVLYAAELHAIQIPVLVMAGDRDVISLEQTTEIFRSLPKASLCILPATGHDMMRERPDDFNRIVRDFLERR